MITAQSNASMATQSFVIQTASPPKDGKIVLSKNAASSFDTIWISTNGWIVDGNAEPLLYSFSYSYIQNYQSIVIPLSRFSKIQNIAMKIPFISSDQTASGNEYETSQNMTIIVNVMDTFGSESSTTATLQIIPQKLKIESVTTKLSQISKENLNDALNRQDWDAVSQVNSLLLSSINSLQSSGNDLNGENQIAIDELKLNILDSLSTIKKRIIPF
eukprot:TRINITY_DN5712_c0_g1_i21.p2 TRINITY_DN5712_c0_g1~~TRINITY_DN5712_c0_g1_i21.p2  ORF type:complete len:216 (+),score=49.77 TRINITY_DN5712_c0_g1_i21:587-1234(+)